MSDTVNKSTYQMAGMVLAILHVMVFFLPLQRRFIIKGLMVGAIK